MLETADEEKLEVKKVEEVDDTPVQTPSDPIKDATSTITDAATGAGARSYFSSLMGTKK